MVVSQRTDDKIRSTLFLLGFQAKIICPSCRSTFADLKNLTRHVIEECPRSGKFRCKVCGSRRDSRRRDNLICHLKKMHNIESNYTNVINYIAFQ